MQQFSRLTNSERLELRVTKDTQFWLPLLKHVDMTWLKEESRLLSDLPKTINEFWGLK